MESAKTKKSYPEESEFVLFDTSQCQNFQLHEESPRSADEAGFRLGRPLFENLKQDPDFNRAFEDAVRLETERRIQAENAVLLDEARAAAEKKGYETGHALAESESLARLKTLDNACKAVLEQKVQVLRSHEQHWIAALRRTLECFGVPNVPMSIESIQGWLSSCLEDFASHGELQILVDPESYLGVGSSAMDRVRIQPDAALQKGQIIVKVSDRELFFSPDRQWKQITEIFESFK